MLTWSFLFRKVLVVRGFWPQLLEKHAPWVFLAQLLFAASGLMAESPLVFQRLGVDQGLSHDTVQAVLQDHRGFFWIGTRDGLDRWDGVEVVSFRHEPGRPDSLSGNSISALLEDSEGTLWIASNGGLDRLDPGQHAPRRVELPEALERPRSVYSLALADDGTLWAGSSGGLFRKTAGSDAFVRWQPTSPSSRLSQDSVVRIEARKDGLWILTRSDVGTHAATLHRIVGDRVVDRWTLSTQWEMAFAFHVDRRGRIWIDGHCPARVDGQGSLVPSCPQPAGELTWGFLEDTDGTLWAATSSGLLRHRGGNTTRVHLDPNGESWLSEHVLTVGRDRWGGLIAGTLAGFFRQDPFRKPFHFATHRPHDSYSLPASPLSAIASTAGKHLWIGTYGDGLVLFDVARGVRGRWHHRPGDKTSLCGDLIWSLDSTPHRLWIGTEHGLCSLDLASGRFRPWPISALRPGHSRRVNTVLATPGGTLWLGTPQGLVRDQFASGASELVPLGSAYRRGSGPDIIMVRRLSRDRLAIATQEQALVLDPRTGATRALRLFDGPERLVTVYDILKDGDALWFATGEGLVRLGPGGSRRRFGIADGLPGDVVASLTRDTAGRVWAGTNRGLAEVVPAAGGFTIRGFDVGDGIGNVELNRHAVFASQGFLAFGGMSGLTYFDPTAIHRNTIPPALALTRVEIAGRNGIRELPVPLNGPIVLAPQDHSVTIGFAALAFTNPARNRYAYRFDGLGPAWVNTGHRRFVTLAALAPGRYRLQLRGSNEDGVWSAPARDVAIVVRPPFWQTAGFRLAVIALIAAAILAFYRWRVAQLLALERVRLKIAGDLHDDLSTDLSGIAVAADAVAGRNELSGEARNLLLRVRDTALGLADGVRDVVWALDPEHDSLEATIRRMRKAAATLLAGKEWSFEIAPEVATGEIAMAQRRNLLLILKESLHNVVRHAEAKRVALRLTAEKGSLLLSVSDDGVGFDPGFAAHGRGLASLCRRATEIEGTLAIETSPGNGTTVTLRIPRTRDRRGR